MLLQEPNHSPYDLRFSFLGFPVRVAWGFWLMAILFGYSWVQGLDQMQPELSPGILPLMVLWTLCVFVSILIHELGHAIAFRQNGIESSVVLYHFGGLAVPRSGGRSSGHLTPGQDVWIFLAGPLAQFVSAIVVIAGLKVSGYRLDQFSSVSRFPELIQRALGADQGATMITDNIGLYSLVDFYLFPSVFWALLNLVPVLPLDGGQIANSLVQMRGGSVQQALWISVVASGVMAAWGFSGGQQYMGILFLVLGITSFQQLQQLGQARF